jgi:hypothetical protein
MSHAKVLREFLECEDFDAMVVLEDDAQHYSFGPDVLIKAISELPDTWQVLYITIHPRGSSSYIPFSEHLMRPTHGRTTSAYMVSKAGARMLHARYATMVKESDVVMESCLPSEHIFACTPLCSSQRNGDISTIDLVPTMFNCGAPYFLSVSAPPVVIDLRLETAWERRLMIVSKYVTWCVRHNCHPVVLLHESCPASYPFPKILTASTSATSVPDEPCDSKFARSILTMIMGGVTVPNEVRASVVGLAPSDGARTYLTGSGSVASYAKHKSEMFGALWLGTHASAVRRAPGHELASLFDAVWGTE